MSAVSSHSFQQFTPHMISAPLPYLLSSPESRNSRRMKRQIIIKQSFSGLHINQNTHTPLAEQQILGCNGLLSGRVAQLS